jgi:hypothetical protein
MAKEEREEMDKAQKKTPAKGGKTSRTMSGNDWANDGR